MGTESRSARFWHERWEQNQIRFHQAEVNPLLREYWPVLEVEASTRVFVPLCGKSHDMRWLRQRGHPVVGVELSPIACRDFFAEADVAPRISRRGSFEVYEAEGFRLYCGDFFALTAEDLEGVGAVFDRASLFALDADDRRAYVRAMRSLLAPGAHTLLLTIEFESGSMNGPPFSVTQDEIFALYADGFEIERLARMGGLAAERRFEERGLATVAQAVYRLERR